MSGSSIGSVVGGAIGFMIGGPAGIQYGIAIGGVAGGLLMPDEIGLEDQYGPRLHSLKTTTSTYGSSINRVYGASRIGGEIITSQDIKGTKHVREEEVGKGGSESYEVVTYSYSIDMAIALCEGPISGIRKVWANSVLIYDISAGGTTAAYQASHETSGQMTFYLGTPTQEVDWLLQSINSDAPAYRNVAYIVFNNFQLEKYGDTIPNITCEVIKEGSLVQQENTVLSRNFDQEMRSLVTYTNPLFLNTPNLNNSNYLFPCMAVDFEDPALFTIFKYSLTGQLLDYKEIDTGFGLTSLNYGQGSGDAVLFSAATNKTETIIWRFNENLDVEESWQIYSTNDPAWFAPEFIAYGDNTLFVAAKSDSPARVYNYIWSSKLQSGSANPSIADPRTETLIPYDALSDLQSTAPFVVGNSTLVMLSDFSLSGLKVARVWSTDGTLLGDIDVNGHDYDSWFFTDNIGSYVINDNKYYHSRSDLTTQATYVMALDLTNLSVLYTIRIDCPSTYTWIGTGGVYNNGLIASQDPTDGPYNIFLAPALDSNEVTVSSICQELMSDSNIDLSEVDLSDIDSLLVEGFTIDKSSSVRSSISSLQTAYLFDLIEKDFKIYSKIRGSSSIKLIENLGANKDEELEHKKELITELPKKVTFRYANSDIDYQISSQSSLRIGGSSDNNIAVDLPLILNDTQAKKLTEVYLFNAWEAKNTFKFAITLDGNTELNVSDVVSLIYNNEVINVRLLKIVMTSDYILECDAVVEAGYTSTAIGQDTSSGFIPPDLTANAPSNLFVFNAPTLSNLVLNDLGVYYVASGQNAKWQGCVVFKSKDLGQTYSDVGAVLIEGTFGSTSSILLPGPTGTVDLVNTLTLILISGSLESISLEELFNGKNYMMVGNEVIQYQYVTDLGNNEYEISVLLRGRRGTEHETTNHTHGEKFVFLDPNVVNFNFSELNSERRYKAVTFGTYLDDANSISNTCDGTHLEPFSPVNQTSSSYLANGNLNIKWLRRDRYLSGYMRSLPMSEETESYNLYIFDSGQTLIRTELVEGTNEFLYDTTLRLADGLLGTKADSFYYQFSQNSAVVGEGQLSVLVRKYSE